MAAARDGLRCWMGQIYISQNVCTKEEHAPFAQCLGSHYHVHVCRNTIVCAGGAEPESEFRGREGQMKRIACIHYCLCLWAVLVLGIPPTAQVAF